MKDKTGTYQVCSIGAHLDLPVERPPRGPYGKLLTTLDSPLTIFVQQV